MINLCEFTVWDFTNKEKVEVSYCNDPSSGWWEEYRWIDGEDEPILTNGWLTDDEVRKILVKWIKHGNRLKRLGVRRGFLKIFVEGRLILDTTKKTRKGTRKCESATIS